MHHTKRYEEEMTRERKKRAEALAQAIPLVHDCPEEAVDEVIEYVTQRLEEAEKKMKEIKNGHKNGGA